MATFGECMYRVSLWDNDTYNHGGHIKKSCTAPSSTLYLGNYGIIV